jgi:hypothetical protein
MRPCSSRSRPEEALQRRVHGEHAVIEQRARLVGDWLEGLEAQPDKHFLPVVDHLCSLGKSARRRQECLRHEQKNKQSP